jgi:hypothetical protein
VVPAVANINANDVTKINFAFIVNSSVFLFFYYHHYTIALCHLGVKCQEINFYNRKDDKQKKYKGITKKIV